MEELKIVKSNIKIVSPDEKLNTQLLSMLQPDTDCFGIDYSEMHDECKKCTILTEYKDKRSPLWELCKEVCQVETVKEGEGEEKKEEWEKKEEKEETKEEGKGEEKEGEVEEWKEKEWKEKGKKGKLSGLASLAKELLDAGKSEKEVEAEIVKRYVDKGRDKAFALKRAKLYITLAVDSVGSVPKEKEKEVNTDMARGNNIDLAKSMLAEGKTEEEVLATIKKKYMDKGKDEKFADKRSKLYLKLAKK